MILLLLGLIDIFSAILMALMFFKMVPEFLALIFGGILFIKGVIFIKSLASIIDLFAGGVLIFAVLFSINPIFLWIAAALLIQKGIFSFL